MAKRPVHHWRTRPSAMQDPERPVPGYFRVRKRQRGPWAPARITRECHCTVNGGEDNRPHEWRDTCDRYPRLVAEIDGEPVPVWKVWKYGRIIPKPDYDYRVALADWQRRYVHPQL